MSWLATAVFCVLGIISACAQRFPSGFQFGAATAAFQTEGSWNVSDKSPSVWDEWTHRTPSPVADGSTADVACDSYVRWREDVKMLKELGVDIYRFSISWPRLLPSGFPNQISYEAVRYYNSLVDELLRNGIQPHVTIYHWDMPLNIHDLGGWYNPLMVSWFTDYARTVFSLFGDRVKTWLTINEPILMCDIFNRGYGPEPHDSEIGQHLCARHVLLAHASAYRLYGEEFRPKQQGRLSIVNHILWYDPNEPEDEALTELSRQYTIGRYVHPIYSKEGGWPPAIEEYMAKKSLEEGHRVSRLPPFSKEEIELIRGSFDFAAVNHYTTQVVRPARANETDTSPLFGLPEIRAVTSGRAEWPLSENKWQYVYPEGLRKALAWLKTNYGDLEVVITENGYATYRRTLEDDDRVQYYRDYLKQVLLAIEEDGVRVTGYTAWSLMDNFEWADGYNSKFGLYDVDFRDPERKRTPRKSALFYRDVTRTRRLDHQHYKNEL